MLMSRPMIKQLQKDLKACSSTCLNALSILGARSSENQEVKNAISLCEQFENCSEPAMRQTRGGRIRELWMNEAHLPTSSTRRPSDQRAAEVLGSSIVEVITQKKQQPPDVRRNYSHDRIIVMPISLVFTYSQQLHAWPILHELFMLCRKFPIRFVLQPVAIRPTL